MMAATIISRQPVPAPNAERGDPYDDIPEYVVARANPCSAHVGVLTPTSPKYRKGSGACNKS